MPRPTDPAALAVWDASNIRRRARTAKRALTSPASAVGIRAGLASLSAYPRDSAWGRRMLSRRWALLRAAAYPTLLPRHMRAIARKRRGLQAESVPRLSIAAPDPGASSVEVTGGSAASETGTA